MVIKFKLFPVFTLFAAFLVLCLAVPRLIASFYIAYPRFVEERMETGHISVATDAYQDLIHSVEQANHWSASSTNWQLLSLIQTDNYFQHIDQLNDMERKSLLHKIKDAIVNGLKLSPVDPFAWYRLALIRQDEGCSAKEIIELLKMSIFLQGVSPEMVIRRVTLMLKYNNTINGPDFNILLRQIRLAWKFKSTELVKLLLDHTEYTSIVNKAFLNEPLELLEIKKMLGQSFK